MTVREKFEAWLTDGASELHAMMLTDKYETGSYRLIKSENQWEAWQAALASQQPGDDGWIDWGGGKCPVDGDALVNTKWSDGDLIHNRAGVFSWHKSEHAANIIAYRVVKP